MKRILLLLIAVTSLCLTGIAHAGNLYVSGFGGVTLLEESTIKQGGLAGDADFDTGFNAGGAIGYDWGKFRSEFEISYRKNDLDTVSALGVTLDATGDVSSISYLANVYFDFENASSFTPYIGGGIGAATVSLNDVGYLGITAADDDTTVFAYKFAVGTAWKASKMIDLTLDYNLFGTQDPELTDTAGIDFDAEILTHNFSAGVRINF
jgi:OOP family OmpA-OmpF porin